MKSNHPIYTMNLSKKGWLDFLYYKIGNQKYNLELCGTFRDRQFTKWKKYLDCVATVDEFNGTTDWKIKAFFNSINQRQILPNEIVLDIEEPKQLPNIIKQLKTKQYDYYLFKTGSRGFHIHLFFDKEFSSKEKLVILKFFGVDEQKASDRNMIALENCPHWKTGKLKEQVLTL